MPLNLGPFTPGPPSFTCTSGTVSPSQKCQAEQSSAGIYPGDATQLLQLLPDPMPPTVVLTDPPYGIGLTNHALGQIRHRTRRTTPYKILGDTSPDVGLDVIAWSAARDLPLIVFASPWKPWPGDWRNLIVWDKGPAVGAGGDVRTCLKRTWELVQVARNSTRNGKRIGSVWRVPVTSHDYKLHPAAKPVKLLVRLIKTFSAPTDLILDPCAGSGSTAVAAAIADRPYLCFELDPHLVAVARRRIRDLQT